MASNTKFNIDRDKEGAMLAEGWHGFSCERCDSYHVELLDKDARVFAILTIDPADLVELADRLLRLAERRMGLERCTSSMH